jgi:predicted O-methyltransferase YrrM
MSGVAGRVASPVMQLDVRPSAVWRRPLKIERRWDRFRCRTWFRDKEFTSDWCSGNFTLWRRVFSALHDEPLRILEIGSWEGRSATFFLNFFAKATITCVDTFSGGNDHKPEQAFRIEERFDRNLAAFGNRVEKVKGHSRQALATLAAQQRRYDLAYIDGSHERDDVMADSLGVWSMLNPGGSIIWDDYRWGRKMPPEHRPQPAIDQFLAEREGEYRVLSKGYQVIIERLQ